MSRGGSYGLSAARCLVAGMVIALVFIMQAFIRPVSVSAQITSCSNGLVVNVFQGCGTVTSGTYCNGGAIAAPGQACNTGYTACANGSIVTSGTYCPTYSYPICPYGGGLVAAQACPQSAYQSGSCSQYLLSSTSCYGTTAVAGTVSTTASCNGQRAAGNGSCSTAPSRQYCPAVGGYVVPESCPTATASQNTAAAGPNNTEAAQPSGSSQLISCPGTGAQVPAGQQSQCPQTCPNGQIEPAGARCPVGSGSTASASSMPSSTSGGAGPGPMVGVRSGWNMVGGPSGTTLTGAASPLYTYQARDTTYETVPAASPLKGGDGYWAYFGGAATVTLPASAATSASVELPAGQFVMIGNPGDTAATVTGADIILVYDPTSGAYAQTTTLTMGQGAWAMSNGGGQATIANGP